MRHFELAKKVIDVFHTVQWRHHGTGMLQAYIDASTRVHVWDPSLLLPGMTTSGAMHNHRFGFESHILTGSLMHTYLEVKEKPYGAHQLFTIENASKGRDVDIIPGKRVMLRMGPDARWGMGTNYRIDKWAFHWARPCELAVTIVELHDKSMDKVASLVAPYGTKPVHAFSANSFIGPDDERNMLLANALAQLLEHYG